jgi:sigma-B regulation protein RsbU (phosphoserine phosphatase)
MRWGGIAARLVRWQVLGGLVVLLALGAAFYVTVRKLILDDAYRQAQAITEQAAQSLSAVFAAARVSGLTLARDIAATRPTREHVIELVRTRATVNPAVYGAMVGLEPGALWPDADYFGWYVGRTGERDLNTPDYRFWEQAWYARTRTADTAWWSDPYLNETAGGLDMVTLNVPLRIDAAEDEPADGMVSVDVRVSQLFDVLSGFRSVGTREPVVVAANGVVMLHPDPAAIGRALQDLAAERPEVAPLVDALRHGRGGQLDAVVDRVGARYGVSYSPVPGTGWMVALGTREDAMLAPLREVRDWLLWIGLITSLALVVVVASVARRITQPLESLTASAAHFARGEFDWPLPEHRTRDEVGVLVEALGSARDSLKQYIAQLADATAARQKLESELSIARDIQMAMLPRDRALDVEGRHLDIAAVLEPAKAVGGDFYNYFAIDGRQIGFYIGDVSDKGVPAALFMARTSTLLEVALERLAAPGAVLAEVGRHLARDNDTGMFATVLCGVIDVSTGTLALASAGHDPPLRVRGDGRREWLPVHSGPALGFEVEALYPEWRGLLTPADTVLAFTDGVTEAFDSAGTAFGTERIEALVHNSGAADAQALAGGLRVAVRTFEGDAPPSDDLTVLVLQYQPVEQPHAAAT